MSPLSHNDYFAETLAELGMRYGSGWPDKFGAALRGWTGSGRRPKALSLFSGGGGMDIGFHDAGFEIVSMVELESKYVATLSANSGSAQAPLGEAVPTCIDIQQFDPTGLPKIDLIIGGPPCQTFSAAGRRAHGVLGVEDPRGVLFVEYIRLLKALRPQAFVFENVYGIVGAQGGEPWRLIVEGFEEAGYQLAWRILDAADYGVPQHRERLFIVGTRIRPFAFPRPTHGPDSGVREHSTAIEALQGVPTDNFDAPLSVGGRYGDLLAEIPPGLNYSFFTEKLGHPKPLFAWRSKFSDFLYKADPEAPVRTVKAQGGQYTGPFHWEGRPFTTAEFKRLQTFPDDYELQGNRSVRIEQIGNSVPPQIARVLAIAIRHQVFDLPVPSTPSVLAPEEKLSFRSLKRSRTRQYQEKARKALQGRVEPGTRGPAVGRYQARLSQAFELSPDVSGPLTVEVSSDWSVAVSNGSRPNGTFIVELSPTRDWSLDVEKVVLRGGLEPDQFVAAWKALERAVADAGVRADLVQLHGYYQYEPRFLGRMAIEGEAGSFWPQLKQVVQHQCVGSTMSTESLAFAWGIQPESVRSVCEWLRSMGFEVRSPSTNPQIPDGAWLIPYPFPTLNPSSVQLRKSLSG